MKSLLAITLTMLIITGCASDQKRTGMGVGIGAVAGAAAGAILSGKGSEGKGAIIGGVFGAAIGGGVGNYLDKQAAELAQVAETTRTDKGLVTKLKGDITFPVGRTSLKSDAQTRLNQIAAIIKKYPKDRLVIVGHTDSSGSDVANQQLSQARADVVRALFVSNGIDGSKVQSIGMGESKPLAANTTSAGRSQNRRVEVEITVEE